MANILVGVHKVVSSNVHVQVQCTIYVHLQTQYSIDNNYVATAVHTVYPQIKAGCFFLS